MLSKKIKQLICLILGFCAADFLFAEELAEEKQEMSKLLVMSLEDLLNTKVITVSKKSEDIFNAPGVISVITAQEIEQFGANNLMEVLERVTSIFPSGAFMFPQNALSIRGDSNDGMDTHVLLLLNGRPFQGGVVGGLNYPIYLSYPLAAIERIEIIRGPGSVLYGTNAFAGVVNIMTKKTFKEKSETRLNIGTGSFGTAVAEAYAGMQKNDLTLVGAVKSFREDGWNFQAVDEEGVLDSTDFSETNNGLFLYGNYQDWTLNFAYLHSEQRHLGELPQWSWQADTIDTGRLLIDLGYERKLSKAWQLQANLAYNNRDSRFGSVVFDIRESSEDWQAELTSLWTTEHFSWLFGGTAWRTSGHTTAYPKNAPGTRLPFLAKFYENWFTLYSQLDYRVSEDIHLIAGMQGAKPADLDWNLVPRLGVIWHFHDDWGVKALYSRAYRGAFEFENSVHAPVVIGEPNLQPETIDTYDLQFMYRAKTYEASLTYFHSQEEDLISVKPVPELGVIQYANQGEVTLQGLELEFKGKATERLYLTGSVSYQENENGEGMDNFTLIPNWLIKFGANYPVNQAVSVGLFNNYVSHAHDVSRRYAGVQYVNPDPDAYLLSTFNLRLDVGLLTQWTRRETLLFNAYVYNLWDAAIYQAEAVRAHINSIPAKQGRGIYMNLSYQF